MKQRTEKQIEAARRNGAKSPGRPRIQPPPPQLQPEIRLRHQLLAESVVLPGESTDRFLNLIEKLTLQLQPASELEASLIDTMATARWRQLRLLSLHCSYTAAEMERYQGPAPNRALQALQRSAESLSALQRDEILYNRQFDRSLRLYLQLKHQKLLPGPDLSIGLTTTGCTWQDEKPENNPSANNSSEINEVPCENP